MKLTGVFRDYINAPKRLAFSVKYIAKKAVVAYSKLIFRHLSREDTISLKTSLMTTGLLTKI
jgi:hypothetical protein